jgi:hypothetical protein
MAKLDIDKIAIIGHVDIGKTVVSEIRETIKNGKETIIVVGDDIIERPPMREIKPVFIIPEVPFIELISRKERRKRERRNKKHGK